MNISRSIARLMTPEDRQELWQRDDAYWARFARGRCIGYRRGMKAGSWFARIRLKGRKHKQIRLGQADDEMSPNNEDVLSFPQALAAAEKWCTAFGDLAIPRDLEWEKKPKFPDLPSSPPAPYTIAHAMVDYLTWYKEYRRGFSAAFYTSRAFIFNDLGHISIEDLTAPELRQWLIKVSETPPRVRSGLDKGQQYMIKPNSAELLRRRQNSANRVLAILKAALNRAFERGIVEDDTAWLRVRGFRGVTKRKVRFLDKEEITSLVEVCPPDLKKLVCGAILTGCRLGELERMIVNDFSNEHKRLAVTDSKSHELRYVSLSHEGIEFFEKLSANRNANAHMFLRRNGTAWRRGGAWRPFKLACNAAGIIPGIRFHDLRHTYASQATMAGISLKIISVQLGHTTTRTVEKYYARLGSAHIDEEIQKRLPNFLSG